MFDQPMPGEEAGFSVSDVPDVPDVAVVLPVRDGAATLGDAVTSVLAQEFTGSIEVCIAVAPSADRTREVADGLAAADPRVSVVDNPAGVTPAGLNAAIRATSAPVVVRVDGHAELPPGYVARAVETLERTGAVNVGGIQDPRGRYPTRNSGSNQTVPPARRSR